MKKKSVINFGYDWWCFSKDRFVGGRWLGATGRFVTCCRFDTNLRRLSENAAVAHGLSDDALAKKKLQKRITESYILPDTIGARNRKFAKVKLKMDFSRQNFYLGNN